MTEPNPYEFESTDSQAPTLSSSSTPQLPPGQRRGKVGHVPLLGTLMVVHGVLEVLFAAFLGAVTVSIPDAVQRGVDTNAVMPARLSTLTFGVYAAMTLWLALLGGLHIYSGARIRRFRGRGGGVAVLCLGFLAVLGGCLCFPASMALGIYGLVVLLDESVALAFRFSDAGFAPDRIRRAFQDLPSVGDHR